MTDTLTLAGLTITAASGINGQTIAGPFTATNPSPNTVVLLCTSPAEVLTRTIAAGVQASIPAPPQGTAWQVAAMPRRELRKVENVAGWVSTGLIAGGAVGGWELGKWLGRKLRGKR